MQYRLFGKHAETISEIGHGTWAMGFMWGSRDDPQSKRALRRALEWGLNFIDTAYLYGKGHSERLIGEVLKESGKQAFVATKVPPLTRAWPPLVGTPWQEAFPEQHLIDITEISLKNLQREQLDLQQLHVWRPEWLAQEALWRRVEQLKSEGKIKYFGVSLNDHDHESAYALVASGLVDSVQVIFNLFEQRPREHLLELCQKHQVAVIARVPLDEGGLSGALTKETVFGKKDWRRHYFSGERLGQVVARAENLKKLLPAGWSLPQLALKFILSEKAVSTAIVGMRSTKHVEENLKVSDLPELSADLLEKLYAQAWPRNFYPVYEG